MPDQSVESFCKVVKSFGPHLTFVCFPYKHHEMRKWLNNKINLFDLFGFIWRYCIYRVRVPRSHCSRSTKATGFSDDMIICISSHTIHISVQIYMSRSTNPIIHHSAAAVRKPSSLTVGLIPQFGLQTPISFAECSTTNPSSTTTSRSVELWLNAC